MGRASSSFSGINRVYAQCLLDCKQFENVVLVNCPKYTQRKRESTPTNSYGKSTRMQKERRFFSKRREGGLDEKRNCIFE